MMRSAEDSPATETETSRSRGGTPIFLSETPSDETSEMRQTRMSRAKQKRLLEQQFVPPDGGWGWFCVLACFLSFALIVGMGRAFGVIYNDVKEAFHDSHMEIAMIPSMINALTVGFGAIAGALTTAFSCRKVAFVGGCLGGIGLSLCFFAMNSLYMLAMFIVSGVGAGLSCTPGLLIVSKYFRKRRGTAVGLSFAGTAVGSIIQPPLLRFLADTYGFRGALLILGGLLFHVCAGALLYRDPRPPKLRRTSLSGPSIRTKDAPFSHWVAAVTHVPQSPPTSQRSIQLTDQQPLIQRRSQVAPRRSVLVAPDVPSPVTKQKRAKLEGRYSIMESEHHNRCFEWIDDNLFLDLNILYNPVFLVVLFSTMFLASGYPQSLVFIPPYAESLGFSTYSGGLLLSISSVGDLMGRLLTGWIFDHERLRKQHGYIFATFFLSTSLIALTLYADFAWMAVCIFIHGLFAGSSYILIPVILSEHHGTVKLASSFGIVRSMQGVTSIIGPMIAGYIRDETGDFVPSFIMLGSSMIVSCFIMCLIIPVKRQYRLQVEDWDTVIREDVS